MPRRSDPQSPLHVFNFRLDFYTQAVDKGSANKRLLLCQGKFSECTGLEATMEPKVIKEGGLNYGAHQRPGPVTFSTVILKRGFSSQSDLWTFFYSVTQLQGFAQRLRTLISVLDSDGSKRSVWQLDRALPIKFKAADLNAKSPEIGIEELHLVHEGLSLVYPKVPGSTPS